MGFSISTLHNIPSVTFMCLVRDGSEESPTMQTLVSFLLQLASVSASRKRAFTLLTELNACCVHNVIYRFSF